MNRAQLFRDSCARFCLLFSHSLFPQLFSGSIVYSSAFLHVFLTILLYYFFKSAYRPVTKGETGSRSCWWLTGLSAGIFRPAGVWWMSIAASFITDQELIPRISEIRSYGGDPAVRSIRSFHKVYRIFLKMNRIFPKIYRIFPKMYRILSQDI